MAESAAHGRDFKDTARKATDYVLTCGGRVDPRLRNRVLLAILLFGGWLLFIVIVASAQPSGKSYSASGLAPTSQVLYRATSSWQDKAVLRSSGSKAAARVYKHTPKIDSSNRTAVVWSESRTVKKNDLHAFSVQLLAGSLVRNVTASLVTKPSTYWTQFVAIRGAAQYQRYVNGQDFESVAISQVMPATFAFNVSQTDQYYFAVQNRGTRDETFLLSFSLAKSFYSVSGAGAECVGKCTLSVSGSSIVMVEVPLSVGFGTDASYVDVKVDFKTKALYWNLFGSFIAIWIVAIIGLIALTYYQYTTKWSSSRVTLGGDQPKGVEEGEVKKPLLAEAPQSYSSSASGTPAPPPTPQKKYDPFANVETNT